MRHFHLNRDLLFLFQIDKSFENIFNIIFYGLILVVVLSQLGFDPLAMFLSISGVILAFAFSTSFYICNGPSTWCSLR